MPTNDYIFKRLFGYKGNEAITKDLLENILKTKIVGKISIESSKVLEKDLKDDKIGILDILVELEGNVQCNLEMQVIQRNDLPQRILKYWSKLYDKAVQSGKKYEEAKKTIIVLITSFDINFGIPKYHTTWHIREDEYSEILLTELLEIHIISIARLEKVEKIKSKENDKLISWIKFIKNPNLLEEKDMASTKIKEAKQEYDKIVDDNREKYLAWLRMKYTWDMQDMEQTGISKGISKGIKEGIKEGIKKEKIEIAKKMLDDKIEIETIVKYTRTYEGRNRKIKIEI